MVRFIVSASIDIVPDLNASSFPKIKTLASNKTAITGIINLAHFIALEYDLIKFCINYEKKYHLLTNLQGQVLRALVEN